MLLSCKEWFLFITEIKIFVSPSSEHIKSDLNFNKLLFKLFTIVQTAIQWLIRFMIIAKCISISHLPTKLSQQL